MWVESSPDAPASFGLEGEEGRKDGQCGGGADVTVGSGSTHKRTQRALSQSKPFSTFLVYFLFVVLTALAPPTSSRGELFVATTRAYSHEQRAKRYPSHANMLCVAPVCAER